MAVILVVLLGLGVASSLNLGNPQGLHFDVNNEYATSYEDYKPRDYKFEYGVSDPHTGDHKSHWEVREHGVVRGEYSLLEPDGTTRVIQYTADDHGFRAVVKKIGQAVHPSHHAQNAHNTVAVPEVQIGHFAEPYFKTYDGAAENYVNVVDDINLHPLLSNVQEISQDPGFNAHSQGPSDLSHIVAGSELDYHNYQSSGISSVGDNTENHLIHGHKLETIHGDTHIPIQHEAVYIPETTHNQEPVQIVESIQQEPAYSYEYPHTQPPSHQLVQIQNYGPIDIPESIKIHESIGSQQPVQILERTNSIHNLGELPATTGLKVEHPHGESSSSFVGRTGNSEDDSAYTRHDKGSEVSGVADHSGWKSFESQLPYSY